MKVTVLQYKLFYSAILCQEGTNGTSCDNTPDTPTDYHFVSQVLIYNFKYFIAFICQWLIHARCSVNNWLN
jgi:hypothetical protein